MKTDLYLFEVYRRNCFKKQDYSAAYIQERANNFVFHICVLIKNERIRTRGYTFARVECRARAWVTRRYWYKQGAGLSWSVLCNQGPINIEGSQSAWTLSGSAVLCSGLSLTFRAVPQHFLFIFHFEMPRADVIPRGTRAPVAPLTKRRIMLIVSAIRSTARI